MELQSSNARNAIEKLVKGQDRKGKRFMKRLFKKRRMLSASSLLLTSFFLCLFLSVGCSVIKNNAAETPNIFVNEKKDNNAEEDF